MSRVLLKPFTCPASIGINRRWPIRSQEIANLLASYRSLFLQVGSELPFFFSFSLYKRSMEKIFSLARDQGRKSSLSHEPFLQDRGTRPSSGLSSLPARGLGHPTKATGGGGDGSGICEPSDTGNEEEAREAKEVQLDMSLLLPLTRCRSRPWC